MAEAVGHKRPAPLAVLSSARSPHLPFPTLPFPAARGQIWEMGEGGEHGKLVAMFICMPERLGLCTYPEGPEQSRRGEKEGIRGGVL